MQEITGVREIHGNKVEIGGNNILKQKVFHDIDNLGNKFYQKNPRREKNLGNWEVKNDRGSIKRKLEISKGKEKQHLTINFEQKKMIGFDFMLSDGKTVVNLQINEDRRLIVSRKDIKGRKIYGSENLNPREYLELTNFPFKFALDRNVNAIVDKVDPNKVIRYVLPVASAVALGGKLALSQLGTPNNATSLNTLFFNRPALSQSVGDSVKDQAVDRLPTSLESKLGAEKKGISDLGLLQELGFVLRFYDPEKPIKQPLDKAIRDYLNNPTDPQDKNRYVRPDGKLVGNLENALKEIKNNPKSQDSFYGLIDAIHEFNTGKGIVTPRKILDQANATGDNLRTAYIDTKDKVTGEPEFNRGLIKGNEYFGYILPGDFIVTEDNQSGIVTSTKKDENGVLLSVNILVFNEQTGKVNIKTVFAENYPIGFSYFPK
ncbi:MAG: hypothetical protein WC894_06060 [Patescibacteria group bacterium]